MKALSSASNSSKGFAYTCATSENQWKAFVPLCRTCAENYSHKKCLHTEDERSFTGSWVSDELKTAVEKGYVIKQMYEVWHFAKTRYVQQTKYGGIFTEYINTFLKLKQEASGWPE